MPCDVGQGEGTCRDVLIVKARLRKLIKRLSEFAFRDLASQCLLH